MKAYPTYRSYCMFLYKIQGKNNKRLMTTFEKVVKYIFGLILITGFWLSLGFIILIVKLCASGPQYSQSRKYPSSQYRRVVKEGIFFDSIEYHER